MAFIGNTNTTQAFTPAVDFFSGDASTTAFTLSKPVASVAQVQAVVNNVAQNPSDAFTVSSNTITFTSAPSSGTNNIYVYYTSPITQVIAPGQGTVDTNSLSSSLLVPPAMVSDQDNTSTGYFDLPVGTTAERPGSSAVGMIRYNTTESLYEAYTSTGWRSITTAPYTYSIDVLIVAGGGGGSRGTGGGGSGGGGLLYGSTSVISQIAYSLVVGAGGAAAAASGTLGSVGTNSTGFSATANGGGVGSINGTLGLTGGSGGGAGGASINGSNRANTAATQGASGGLTGAGFTGGAATGSSYYAGSGGGGAGAVGVNHNGSSGSPGGAGGAGYTWLNGSVYAGGGGGGSENVVGASSGGTGGGGQGGDVSVLPTAGTANTGGGGGAAGSNQAITSNGGSGIVIIRYAGAQRGTGGTVTSAGGYTYHTFTSSDTYTA